MSLRSPFLKIFTHPGRLAVAIFGLHLVALLPAASAQLAGALDATFNPGTGPDSYVYATAVQNDGKILIGGAFANVAGVGRGIIARLNADGSLDATFNPGASANGYVNALAVQADGKIIAAGQFTLIGGVARQYIARFNADGTVDASFSPAADDYILASAVQSDGKILIGGAFGMVDGAPRNRLARLNANGSLDTAFDPGAGANNFVLDLAIQGDGKVVVAGEFTSIGGAAHAGIARLSANGAIDAGFNPGSGADNYVYAVALQGDGKVVLGGNFHAINGVTRNTVARLNADGTVDAGFDPGTGPDGVHTVAVQADGKVVIGGPFDTVVGTPRNRIARLKPDGSLDLSFDPGSGANDLVYKLSLQSDGKVVLGGYFTSVNGVARNYIARLDADPPAPPVITAPASVSAQVGVAFAFAITATNAPTSFAASGLPAGLTVDPLTGLISGTPTAPGAFTLGLSAANAGGTGAGALMLNVTTPASNVQAVNILSPPSNINLAVGETVELQVSVDAVAGTLARVEFDVDDAAGSAAAHLFLGDSTAARDSKTWAPAALGDFLLSATATDTAGNQTRSRIPIHVVSGGDAPVSMLLSGLDGKTFAAGSELPLVGLAEDLSGEPIQDAQFFADGVPVTGSPASAGQAGNGVRPKESITSPYVQANTILGNRVQDLLLTLVGTSKSGIATVSGGATIHLAANGGSTLACAILTPVGGSEISTASPAVASVAASSAGVPVSSVEFYVNDRRVGMTAVSPYNFAYSLPDPGTYALTAIATDARGISKPSPAVIVTAAAPAPPAVSLTIKGAALTSEAGGKAKFLFTRNGTDLSRDLTVLYKIKGSAIMGIDYETPGGSVVIPAGLASAKIKLRTIDNPVEDGTRTITLKLLASPANDYTLGLARKATVSILDND